jgi:hypothetical protein
MVSNDYLFAKNGADAADNEHPKIWLFGQEIGIRYGTVSSTLGDDRRRSRSRSAKRESKRSRSPRDRKRQSEREERKREREERMGRSSMWDQAPAQLGQDKIHNAADTPDARFGAPMQAAPTMDFGGKGKGKDGGKGFGGGGFKGKGKY